MFYVELAGSTPEYQQVGFAKIFAKDMESFDKALWKSFLALNNAYAEVITSNGCWAFVRSAFDAMITRWETINWKTNMFNMETIYRIFQASLPEGIYDYDQLHPTIHCMTIHN